MPSPKTPVAETIDATTPAAPSKPTAATTPAVPDTPEVAPESGVAPSPHHGYVQDKDAYLKRLRRIEGQVRGIARMVDEDVYCIDILTQVSAVTKALQTVSLGLVEDHLGHCVVSAAQQSEEAGAAKVKEAAQAIGRLVRS